MISPSPLLNQHHQHLLLQLNIIICCPARENLSDAATDALERSKKRLIISQQKTRRVTKILNTMSDVIQDLKQKDMLSQEVAEDISSSFLGPALDLVMRCLKKSSSQSVKSYPSEL